MQKVKYLSDEDFKSIYSKVPRTCIDLIIVQGKKYLLSKRSIEPFKGMWHFPGGGILHREKIDDAIDRIAKNELGVKIQSSKFLGFTEVLQNGFGHAISLVFQCTISSDQIPKPLTQANEVRFFETIPENTVKEHEDFLRKI